MDCYRVGAVRKDCYVDGIIRITLPAGNTRPAEEKSECVIILGIAIGVEFLRAKNIAKIHNIGLGNKIKFQDGLVEHI